MILLQTVQISLPLFLECMNSDFNQFTNAFESSYDELVFQFET